MANFAMRRGFGSPARVHPAAPRRGGAGLLALAALLSVPLAAQAQTAPPVRPDSPSDPDAGLFLEEAANGPTQADFAHVKALGLRGWLNEQYSLPISDYSALPVASPGSFYAEKRFFENAIYKPDQLRQRVAFALSQFCVVSVVSGFQDSDRSDGIASYMDVLNRNAFGNFRQLMYDLTTNPAVGTFLDAANNDKPNTKTNSLPNENYARELMQLYTIGINQLNLDGSLKLDAKNQPIPTYSNDEVKAFARVFTGYTFPVKPGATPANYNPAYFVGPMVAIESRHDTNPKTLLNGQVIPGGQTTAADVNAALDNIFNHPNVAPFVSRRLIQHLVTSNPSPAYIQRVATVFSNNGAGVRGDMKAVISAILLDGEAVGGVKQNPTFGHLREPAQFVANTIRALNPAGDLFGLPGLSSSFGQHVFDAPSVFSYYTPDFSLSAVDNNGVPYAFYSPEAQLISTNIALARINYINTLVYGALPGTPGLTPPPATTPVNTTVNFSAYDAYAATPGVLVDKLNRYLMHGGMSADMIASVTTAVNAIAATTPHDRVKAALYLILSSQQYQIAGSATAVQNVMGIADYPAVVNKAQTLRFEFRPANGDAPFIRIATMDSAGTFSLPYIPPGKYSVAVKGPVFLQKVVSVDTIAGDATGLDVPLTPGDANGDNSVDTTDFGVLIGAYGGDQAIPNSGYDPQADFNCDGKVDTSDFALLVGGYGMTGDN